MTWLVQTIAFMIVALVILGIIVVINCFAIKRLRKDVGELNGKNYLVIDKD